MTDPATQAVAGMVSCETSAEPLGEAEFRLLYEASAGAIHGYLLAVSGSRSVADDLLQETFCRFLVRRSTPAWTQHDLATLDTAAQRRYLFRIATNLLRDRWRSGEAAPSAELPETGISSDLDATLDIRAMLTHLKPRERELLWLAYVEGMDHAEIASATGLGRLSVRTLLLRARSKARRFLRPEGDRS